MDTAIHRMVAACREGRYPPFIARMASGWAVMGTAQFLRGYCLLLPDPVVPHLNDMQALHREQFLKDMANLGNAVLRVTGALRINYAMFGNVEPALHAHVIPRYTNEPDDKRTSHPWAYDWSSAPAFDAATYEDLIESLRKELVG